MRLGRKLFDFVWVTICTFMFLHKLEFRGKTVDEILYLYFLQYLEIAILCSEDIWEQPMNFADLVLVTVTSI